MPAAGVRWPYRDVQGWCVVTGGGVVTGDGALRTGEVAARAGVNVQTLRYYERRGLLAAPARRPSGQRAYPESAVARLRAIKGAQRLGFTLAEIAELIRATSGGGAVAGGPAELHRRARAKLAELDERVAELLATRAALSAMLAAECDSLLDCRCGALPAPEVEPAGRARSRDSGGRQA